MFDRWSKKDGGLEFRVLQDIDHFVLVVRRLREGQVPEYVYWKGQPSLEAAMADLPNAERYVAGL